MHTSFHKAWIEENLLLEVPGNAMRDLLTRKACDCARRNHLLTTHTLLFRATVISSLLFMLPVSSHLKEGTRIDARVVHAESPAEFWLQPLLRLPSDGPAFLSDLEASICSSSTAQLTRRTLQIGALYAVVPEESYEPERWCRARLLDLPSDSSALLKLIDHGRRKLMSCDRLRLLEERFQRPSPYALRCALRGLDCSSIGESILSSKRS